MDAHARREGRAETEAWINPPGVVSVPEWLLAAPDDDVLLTLLNVSGRVRDGWGAELAEPLGRMYDQLVERRARLAASPALHCSPQTASRHVLRLHM